MAASLTFFFTVYLCLFLYFSVICTWWFGKHCWRMLWNKSSSHQVRPIILVSRVLWTLKILWCFIWVYIVEEFSRIQWFCSPVSPLIIINYMSWALLCVLNGEYLVNKPLLAAGIFAVNVEYEKWSEKRTFDWETLLTCYNVKWD